MVRAYTIGVSTTRIINNGFTFKKVWVVPERVSFEEVAEHVAAGGVRVNVVTYYDDGEWWD